MKNVAILGSTGSIGRSTLDVLRHMGSDYRVTSLAAGSRIELLAEQARDFTPRRVAIADPADTDKLQQLLGQSSVDLLSGEQALVDLASDPETDVVVNALVGGIGLRATLSALTAGKTVALANKESIVMAGRLVMQAAADHDGLLIPVDSEHSAVLQCLRGENPRQIRRLILTASGGPFRDRPLKSFGSITPREALRHPNWQMGPKITVDSATLMNKGLEIIEAHYLFDLPPERIQVVIHPQSVVHSLVEFVDGSLKAQLSTPDMRIPIQYALTYPERLPAEFVATDLIKIHSLDFEAPDLDRFPCLSLAYKALGSGEEYPAVLNSANETAVQAFLEGKLAFSDISTLIEEAMEAFRVSQTSRGEDLERVLLIDDWTRNWCVSRIQTLKH